MKRLSRIVRRKREAPMHVSRPALPPGPAMEASADVAPVALGDQHSIPCEVIDLATGPFNAAFPAIAARLHGTKK